MTSNAAAVEPAGNSNFSKVKSSVSVSITTMRNSDRLNLRVIIDNNSGFTTITITLDGNSNISQISSSKTNSSVSDLDNLQLTT